MGLFNREKECWCRSEFQNTALAIATYLTVNSLLLIRISDAYQFLFRKILFLLDPSDLGAECTCSGDISDSTDISSFTLRCRETFVSSGQGAQSVPRAHLCKYTSKRYLFRKPPLALSPSQCHQHCDIPMISVIISNVIKQQLITQPGEL